jgi:galactokinase
VVAHLQKAHPEVKALRDVTLDMLKAEEAALDPADLRRARHVVPENTRPVQMADALQAGNLELAGQLMDDSHASLRDLYEVSCEELDLITEIARAQPGCFGARMTGAGFGGCAVALVRAEATAPFCETVLSAYKAKIDLPAALYPCRPMPGARLL